MPRNPPNMKKGILKVKQQPTATNPGGETSEQIASIQNPKAKTDNGDIIFDGTGTTPVVDPQAGGTPTRSNGAVIDGRLPQLNVPTAKDTQTVAATFKHIVFDPMTIKNNADAVAKMHASQKSSLQEVLPSKEMATVMTFGITMDDLESVYSIANTASATEKTTAYTEIARGIQTVHKMQTIPHNLKIIQSENGRHALIMEDLGNWKFNSNVEFRAQAGIMAVKLAKQLGIDKPFVLDIASEYATGSMIDPVKYSLLGLPPKEIRDALNKNLRFQGKGDMSLTETQRLLGHSVVYSNFDGSDTTVMFCGAMTQSIINYAAERWATNMIPLDDYHNEILATFPDYYRIKRFTEIEHRHGIVYRERDQGSLMPLVRAIPRDVSSYYFKKMMTSIEDVPVNVISMQDASSQLAADTSQSSSRAQHVSMLTGGLTTTNAARMRALTVLTCIFPGFNVDMTFSLSPSICDVVSASCLLLFRPAHAISDQLYHYCLLNMATFLLGSLNDYLGNHDIAALRNLLEGEGWYITQRYESRRLTFNHEPLRSPGLIGEYYVPFNINPGTGLHVEARLEDWIARIARGRFRANAGLGVAIAAMLRQCITRTQLFWRDYCMMISRYRTLIPDELYRSLAATPGDYSIPVKDEYSFFFTLAKVDLSEAYIGGIDAASNEYLAEYATLARDISLSLTLVNAVFKEVPRDSGSIISQANAMNVVIQEVFKDKPLISEIMLTLLSMSAPDGKTGYKHYLLSLVGRDYPIYDAPSVDILDKLCTMITDNGGYFGYTRRILVLPRSVKIAVDERFGFRDSPFCERLPTHVLGGPIRQMTYSEFAKLDKARTAIENGLIIHDAYFNYEFQIFPADGMTTLENDIFMTSTERNEVKPIKFLIHFENYDNPGLEDRSSLNVAYKLYIETPACLLPLSEYKTSKATFLSPDSSKVYIDRPALLYSQM